MNAKTPDDLLQQVNEAVSTNWKDSKRYLWLLSPALPLIGLTAMSAYAVAPKKLRPLAWTGPVMVHGRLYGPLQDRYRDKGSHPVVDQDHIVVPGIFDGQIKGPCLKVHIRP